MSFLRNKTRPSICGRADQRVLGFAAMSAQRIMGVVVGLGVAAGAVVGVAAGASGSDSTGSVSLAETAAAGPGVAAVARPWGSLPRHRPTVPSPTPTTTRRSPKPSPRPPRSTRRCLPTSKRRSSRSTPTSTSSAAAGRTSPTACSTAASGSRSASSTTINAPPVSRRCKASCRRPASPTSTR